MKPHSIFFLLSLILLAAANSVLFAQWVQTNGPTGTTVTKVVRHNGMLFASTEMGVFRSTNEGERWDLSSTGITNLTVWALFSDGVYLFAGTRSGMVFRSSNNGGSWEDVSTGSTSGSGCAFALKDTFLIHSAGSAMFRSSNHGTTWDSIASWPNHNYDITVQGTTLFTANSPVYRSTDDGVNWVEVDSGLAGLSFYSLAVMGINLYVASDSGVFMTTNQGTSWTKADSGILSTNVQVLCAKDTFLFAASNSFASTIYRSSDAGTHWMPIGNFKWFVHSFTVDDNNLFASVSRVGIYRSTDDGITWVDRNGGFVYTRIYQIFVSEYWQNTIFASTDDHGTFRSGDGGLNWTKFTDFDNTAFTELDSLLFMGGSYFGSPILYRSSDNGQTWDYIYTGVAGTSIRILFVKGNVIFLGASGVYRSTDAGNTWTAINNGMSPASIWSFASKDSFLFVSSEGSVYVTTNDGDNWQSAGLNNIRSLAVSGDNIVAGGNLVYVSTNNGANWNPISPSPGVSSFCTVGQSVFAGGGSNVFRSTDHGLSWDTISSGLSAIPITSLAATEDFLLAGTYWAGVWRRPLSEITNADNQTNTAPSSFYLYQNYPNPFNPTTIIVFSLPSRSFVSLKTFDALGRVVSTLVSEELPVGTYSQQWNAIGLSSGVYFYRLQAGAFTETKKLILLR